MCFVTSLFAYFANRDAQKFVRIGHPLSVFFMLEAIGFFFTVQMFYVTPQLLGKWGLYEPSWIVAIFIMHNILGNMWVCHYTKSSVASLPEDRRVPSPGDEHLWHFCETCQAMMPPRSWHCKLCGVCILKRDHHCTMTATCIGHNNQRYFFWFIFYLALGIILCFCTTIKHVGTNLIRIECTVKRTSSSEMRLPCKLSDSISFDLFFDRLLLILTIFAMGICAFTLILHALFVCSNTTFFTLDDPNYDLGFRKNFRLVMGERGFWTMLSPAIRSPLLHDGTQWQIKQSLVEV